jgi:magnesium transporter
MLKRIYSFEKDLYRILKFNSKKLGSAPGTLVKETTDVPAEIQLTRYNSEFAEHIHIDPAETDLGTLVKDDCINWLNITGNLDENLLNRIGKVFNIHPLVLEEIQSNSINTKYEEYDNHVFIVMKTITSDITESFSVVSIKILVGDNFVITFNEKSIPLYLSLLRRIHQKKSRFRSFGKDYFIYAVLDIIGDTAYSSLNSMVEDFETAEEDLMLNFQSFDIHNIYSFKKHIFFSRQALRSQKDIISKLESSELFDISEGVSPYFKRLNDHFTQIKDVTDNLHASSQDMFNLYTSLNGHKMNEIMKTLTVFAAIFIPLTFIAGVYGMNFEFMPELKYKWAYPLCLGGMMAAGVGMLAYFKHRKWF